MLQHDLQRTLRCCSGCETRTSGGDALQNVAADWGALPLVPQRYCAGVCEDEGAYCSMLELTVPLYNRPCPEVCCMVGLRHVHKAWRTLRIAGCCESLLLDPMQHSVHACTGSIDSIALTAT